MGTQKTVTTPFSENLIYVPLLAGNFPHDPDAERESDPWFIPDEVEDPEEREGTDLESYEYLYRKPFIPLRAPRRRERDDDWMDPNQPHPVPFPSYGGLQ